MLVAVRGERNAKERERGDVMWAREFQRRREALSMPGLGGAGAGK